MIKKKVDWVFVFVQVLFGFLMMTGGLLVGFQTNAFFGLSEVEAEEYLVEEVNFLATPHQAVPREPVQDKKLVIIDTNK